MSDKVEGAGGLRAAADYVVRAWVFGQGQPGRLSNAMAGLESALRASEPGLRDAMEKLAKSYCDEAVRYRAAEIEPQIYLEEAASDIRAQIALARTPPQKTEGTP